MTILPKSKIRKGQEKEGQEGFDENVLPRCHHQVKGRASAQGLVVPLAN